MTKSETSSVRSQQMFASRYSGGGTSTRRELMRDVIVALAPIVLTTRVGSAVGFQQSTARRAIAEVPYDAALLPQGIRSRFVNDINGLRVHVLEAGVGTTERPAILLLHGFPELAYSWRNVMLPLASAGFHVIAPDRRGYGRTSGWDVSYDDDLDPFGTLSQVNDGLGLISALGYRSVAAVIGHDQGSPLAGWCALVRPDVFRSVVMMSAPFGGAPALPFNTASAAIGRTAAADAIYDDLAKLTPPRKHYQRYYQTREANENMWHPPQGIHAFLRAYYHMKSADWRQNDPHPLAARTAAEWARLPRYYVMDLNKGMAETVAAEMPTAAEITACQWLPDAELRVYSEEYARTGFQGGLNGYRRGRVDTDLQVFAGKTIDVPSMFVGGKKDWGVYQNPGTLERLEKVHATKYQGTHLVDGAGHWIQQEQPEQVSKLLLQFLGKQAQLRG
jgi:pimeloyl-ACP methyl ester carboxylesterase